MSEAMIGFHTVTDPVGAVHVCFCEKRRNHTSPDLALDEWAAGLRSIGVQG